MPVLMVGVTFSFPTLCNRSSMYQAPTPKTFPLQVLFVDMQSQASQDAWRDMQEAVGDGVLLGVLQTPDKAGASPRVVSTESHEVAPVPVLFQASAAFAELAFAWRKSIEQLMNTRWDMVENPYARFCVTRQGILVHEDPLDWLVDAVGDDVLEGTACGPLPCALLVPLPSTAHAALAAASGHIALPHAGLFDADLEAAAGQNGQDRLLPLVWKVVPTEPHEGNTLVV